MPKILLLGKDGQVGWELQRSLAPLGELVALGQDEADFMVPGLLAKIVAAHAPDVIVNAAAYTAVDKAETDVEAARRVNQDAVLELAQSAARCGAWLVHYSTDYVYEGTGTAPYTENSATGPLSVYGQTKLGGEEAIAESGVPYLIFRTSWVYAARGGNFARTMLRLAGDRDSLRVIADQHGAPTSAELIADVTAFALYRLQVDPDLARKASGVYHLVAAGETSWHGYASFVVAEALRNGASLKAVPDRIEPIPTEAYPLPAPRPRNSRMDTGKLRDTFGLHLPDWRTGVARVVREWVA